MPLVEPGKKAPAFSLKDQHGKVHRLADYAGRPVVLYFYPKDDTPGCTKEACAFRDALPKFKPSKAAVFGVSILDEASKAKFADKYDLNFPLLADADHEVAEKYGVWQQKSLYGRSFMGLVRTTYLIGPDGKGREALGQRQSGRPRGGCPRRGQGTLDGAWVLRFEVFGAQRTAPRLAPAPSRSDGRPSTRPSAARRASCRNRWPARSSPGPTIPSCRSRLDGDARQVGQERPADSLSPPFRKHEQILEVEAPPAEKRRVGVEPDGEADRLRADPRDDHCGGGRRSEQRFAYALLGRDDRVGEPLVVGERLDQPQDEWDIRLGRRIDAKHGWYLVPRGSRQVALSRTGVMPPPATRTSSACIFPSSDAGVNPSAY